MKLTTDTIVAAATALSQPSTKFTKMANADKFAVIKAMRVFRPVAEAFDKFKADAREKLKPENFEVMQEQAKRYDELTEAERVDFTVAYNDYERAVNDCVTDELRKEVEVDYQTISEEAFGALLESNDFNIVTSMALQDALCGPADKKE